MSSDPQPAPDIALNLTLGTFELSDAQLEIADYVPIHDSTE